MARCIQPPSPHASPVKGAPRHTSWVPTYTRLLLRWHKQPVIVVQVVQELLWGLGGVAILLCVWMQAQVVICCLDQFAIRDDLITKVLVKASFQQVSLACKA